MTWTPRNSYDEDEDDEDEDDRSSGEESSQLKQLELTIAEDDEGYDEDLLFTPKGKSNPIPAPALLHAVAILGSAPPPPPVWGTQNEVFQKPPFPCI